MLKKINKRGSKAQSDIVSYVLLIVIALGLAAGVYSFMKFYIPKDKETCSADISLYVENYKCHVNPDNAHKIIELTLKNKGLFNITGFVIKGGENYNELPITALETTDFGLNSSIPGRYYFENQLKAGLSKTTTFDYNIMGKIERVRIQPFIVSSKNTILLCERIADVKIEGCS